MDTVKNVGPHPVDVSDGRTVGPGETLDNVALSNTHNKDLFDQGFIIPLDDTPASVLAPDPPDEQPGVVGDEPKTPARHSTRGDK